MTNNDTLTTIVSDIPPCYAPYGRDGQPCGCGRCYRIPTNPEANMTNNEIPEIDWPSSPPCGRTYCAYDCAMCQPIVDAMYEAHNRYWENRNSETGEIDPGPHGDAENGPHSDDVPDHLRTDIKPDPFPQPTPDWQKQMLARSMQALRDGQRVHVMIPSGY